MSGDVPPAQFPAARTLAIWGSCVTRDAIETDDPRLALVRYHARTSWVSQASTPYETEGVNLTGLSDFGRRLVEEEYQKTVVDELILRKPSLVVFDLIDERFVLLRTGPTWWTMSDYVQATPLNDVIRAAPHSRTEYLDGRRTRLFEAAVRTLAPRLSAGLPSTTFVLHEAVWATATAQGERFPSDHAAKAAAMNRRLEEQFQVLQDAFGPRLVSLIPPPELVVADSNQRWGLAPFHYVPEYYTWLRTALSDIDVDADTAAVVPPALRDSERTGVRAAVTAARRRLADSSLGQVAPRALRKGRRELGAIRRRTASRDGQ